MKFSSVKFTKNQNSKPPKWLKCHFLTFWNKPKWISHKIKVAVKSWNFQNVSNSPIEAWGWPPRPPGSKTDIFCQIMTSSNQLVVVGMNERRMNVERQTNVVKWKCLLPLSKVGRTGPAFDGRWNTLLLPLDNGSPLRSMAFKTSDRWTQSRKPLILQRIRTVMIMYVTYKGERSCFLCC